MSLPLPAIDRLFERLTATYGRQFTTTYEGIDINSVKSTWCHELAEFSRSRESMMRIAWALENLPERPPNVIAFRNLCRCAPAPEAPRLESQPANKERIAAEMAKLGHLRKAPSAGGLDGRAWARSIIARKEAGERILPYALNCAREALGRRVESEEVAA